MSSESCSNYKMKQKHSKTNRILADSQLSTVLKAKIMGSPKAKGYIDLIDLLQQIKTLQHLESIYISDPKMYNDLTIFIFTETYDLSTEKEITNTISDWELDYDTSLRLIIIPLPKIQNNKCDYIIDGYLKV